MICCATCCFFSSCERDAVCSDYKKRCPNFALATGESDEWIEHMIECERFSYRKEWFEYVQEYDEDYLFGS